MLYYCLAKRVKGELKINEDKKTSETKTDNL